MAIPKKIRQKNNEKAAKYFAAGVGGLMALFVVFHWARVLYKRYGLRKKALRLPVACTRLIRGLLIRKVPAFISAGDNAIFLGYIVTNLCIAFTNIDWTNLISLSKRLGWVTISNLALVIFLSLKNTPLAILAHRSYERLQPLHQTAGFTTIACMFMHAIVYITAWDYSHSLHDMLEKDQIMGIVSGLSMLIILATLILRKTHYELFHVIHVIFAMLVLITAGLHRPNLVQKSSYAIIFSATIWGLDRLVRLIRLAISVPGNTAMLTPLPHGGTRIILKKVPLGARPGMHIFLHLPSVRKVELHPFTIVSMKPFELVVAAQDGFTRDLHHLAVANPGKEIKAGIEGPYGCVPDFVGVDKVLLVAGGSGGSYIAGVAVGLLTSRPEITIEFVWVVRHTEILTWFEDPLVELSASPRVNMRIHVIHRDPSPSTPPSPSPSSSVSSLAQPVFDPEKTISPCPNEAAPAQDPEKALPSSSSLPQDYTTLDGRPDIPALITDYVAASADDERLMVVACGPRGMMMQVRRAVAGNLRASGPAVEMHLEHFGW